MIELIEFLTECGIRESSYDIVDGSVVMKRIFFNLSGRGITSLPSSIDKIKVDNLCLNNNLLTSLPESMKDIKVNNINLNNNNISHLPESMKINNIWLLNNCLAEIELSNVIDCLVCDKTVNIKGCYPKEIIMR